MRKYLYTLFLYASIFAVAFGVIRGLDHLFPQKTLAFLMVCVTDPGIDTWSCGDAEEIEIVISDYLFVKEGP